MEVYVLRYFPWHFNTLDEHQEYLEVWATAAQAMNRQAKLIETRNYGGFDICKRKIRTTASSRTSTQG